MDQIRRGAFIALEGIDGSGKGTQIRKLKKHLEGEIELRGENVAIKFMRKFYPYYFSGFENAKQLRSKLVIEESLENIYKLLDLKSTDFLIKIGSANNS